MAYIPANRIEIVRRSSETGTLAPYKEKDGKHRLYILPGERDRTDTIITNGDSGSAVLVDEDGEPRIVGIIVGGSGEAPDMPELRGAPVMYGGKEFAEWVQDELRDELEGKAGGVDVRKDEKLSADVVNAKEE